MNKKYAPWVRAVEGVEAATGSAAPEGEKPSSEEMDWKSEAEKWKKFSRTWEDRAKENEEASKRLAEIEDAGKSELEKLQAELQAAKEAVAKANEDAEKASLLARRADVANEFGISAADRDLYLTASDEEMLRKQAEGLSKRRGPENPNQGKGNGGANKASATEWANSLLGK